jgi:hypothetical protein
MTLCSLLILATSLYSEIHIIYNYAVWLQFAPDLPEIRVDSGNNANLQCVLALRDSTHGRSFLWTGPAVASDRAVITLNASGTVSTLTIASVGRSDEGQYSCSFTGVDTIFITLDVICKLLAIYRSPGFLSVINGAFIISAVEPHFLDVPGNQEFIEETDAVVECPAFFGDPPGNMTWTRNNTNVGTTDERFIPEDDHLTILNIRADDDVLYECLLGRHGIIDSRFVTVAVLERSSLAPRIVEPSNPIEVVYWDSLDLHCRLVVPRDDVYYTWTVDTSSEFRLLTNMTPMFHQDIDKFVGGRYTCRVENNYGYDEQIFFVTILGKNHETLGYIY